MQTILAKMRDRYRDAKSYSDEGTFRNVLRPGEGEKESVTTGRFRTRWRAPDRLRFEVRIEPDRFFDPKTLAIWTPRAGVTKSLFLGGVEEQASLSDALGAMQGVSHGLTGLVPRWLADGGCRCASTYELRGTSACGSATCYELVATLRPNHRVTLFVDTKTSALRKYFARARVAPRPMTPEELERFPPEHRERIANRSLEPFDAEDTVELDPTFDRPIEESAFAYEPPSK